MDMDLYVVGGYVRDEIMGIPSKDVDFSVVLPPGSYSDGFEFMCEELEAAGFKIFLRTPEHLTARAQFPVGSGDFDFPVLAGGQAKPGKKRLTADFVLARNDGHYSDGRRPDVVFPGTLHDDLARRDFTMNAIAKDKSGVYVDPHNGILDIHNRVIRAVGDPRERLLEDALRALRAVRFSVTKDFSIDRDLRFAMQDAAVLDAVADNVADERKREELHKMFAFDTVASITALHAFPALSRAVFSKKVWLDPTMKGK